MTIRHAGIRAITLALALVGLASSVDLGTKAGPVSEKSYKNADTLAILSSYRTWTKMNTQPIVLSVDQLAATQI
jgi:hypothetical protein